MSATIPPTPGRIVWYRGADGHIRAAIVARVNGDFNLNLYVFPLDGMDTDCYAKENVTHAAPEQEPGCFPSWHWMPYQLSQAGIKPMIQTGVEGAVCQKPAPGAAYAGYSTLLPHQQRVVDEQAELDDKRTKLRNFTGTVVFSTLDSDEQRRMLNQLDAMNVYSDILGERIVAFALT